MRKRMIGQEPELSPAEDQWLDLEDLARAEISSEDAVHPLEAALRPGGEGGWRAAHPGEQLVRLVFDEPRQIRRIRLVFQEEERQRTQEFALAWSGEDGRTREIVRQQYNFNPPHTTSEIEDYRIALPGAKALELRIRPDISGGDARASLGLIQVA